MKPPQAPGTIGAADAHRGTEPTLRELTYILFDRDDRGRLHGVWRDLIAHESFHHRPGLSAQERTALSYARLQQVNAALGDPRELTLDPRKLAGLHEWTGFLDGGLCTLESIHYNLFLGSLLDHQDPAGPRDLTDYTSMRRTGTFLCTELEHGNDAALLETTAAHDRATGGFVLHTPNPGAQKFMPNTSTTGGPKSALVAARLLTDGQDQGVCLFLVPLSDEFGHLPGIHVRRLPARPGTPVDHCVTAFDQVRLPREALLEGPHGRLGADGTLVSGLGNPRRRFLQTISRVTTGKLCMSAGTLGMARAALSIAVRHSGTRLIAGAKAGLRIPIADHRSHHGRLLGSLATAYAMTFLHRSVVDRWTCHAPGEREETERLVAIAKGWITWQARAIVVECRERCGAHGLFSHNGLSDLASNIEGGITAEGDNLVIWVKAASEMVFGHVVDRGGHQPHAAEERPLEDLSYLRELYAHLEAIWQDRARTAMRQGRRGDPLARWNSASASGLEMVAAHARLQAADAFLAAAASAAEPRTRLLLEDLCRLFLLQELGRHTGDLLSEGRLTPGHVRGLQGAVDRTVENLAPHLALLAEAFDLPEEYLKSVPIAQGRHAVGLDEFLSHDTGHDIWAPQASASPGPGPGEQGHSPLPALSPRLSADTVPGR
ncbi:acyl-CoA oxidase [Streptomyces populi]|uniref:Acyl-CoA oxidase n=2 Tax=Streptomyces populi TaxID=2058924 RepID=A0A2I0SBS8_9ACTN|nr:acyl-CoA oxidase [Streptomyces populi]